MLTLILKVKEKIKFNFKYLVFILIISSAISIYIAFTYDDNNIKSLSMNLGAGLVEIIITICFVQYAIDKQNEKRECIEEKDAILRYDRIMQIYIEKYAMFHYCLSTPIDKRENLIDKIILKTDFKFNDMYDLYRPSMYLCNGITKTGVEEFYQAEGILCSYMIRELENIQFKYNYKLKSIIQNFIEYSLKHDGKNAILSNMDLHGDKQRYVDMVSDWIRNADDDLVDKVHNDAMGKSLLILYVCLYELLISEAKLIIEYNSYIEKIKNERSIYNS